MVMLDYLSTIVREFERTKDGLDEGSELEVRHLKLILSFLCLLARIRSRIPRTKWLVFYNTSILTVLRMQVVHHTRPDCREAGHC